VSLRWKLILSGVAAVLAALVGLGIFYQIVHLSYERDARAIAPLFSSSAAPDRIPIVARAWVRSDRLEEGEPFEINFEIQNNSPGDVTDVAIESLDSGAGMKTNEWSVWRSDRWEVVRDPEFQRLPKGATGRFRCELTPKATGAYSLAAVYAFTTENPDGVRFHNAVIVGPLHVTAPGLEGFLAIGIPLQTVVTAVILPTCLVFLAFYLPYRHQQVAEQTAQAQQTWNLLLPNSLETTRKYYLPVGSAIMRMRRFAGPPMDRRKVFYAFLLVMRDMRACRDDFGGLHLKNRMGEYMATGWWAAISDLVAKAFPLEVSEAVLDRFGTRESYSQFLQRFDDPRTCLVFTKMEDKFKEWCAGTVEGIDAFDKCLPVFLMFGAVLGFEGNRPLQHWYDGKLDESDGLEQALERVGGLKVMGISGWEDEKDKGGKVLTTGLVSETKDYVANVKKEVRQAKAHVTS
jgi:hypothetical protein